MKQEEVLVKRKLTLKKGIVEVTIIVSFENPHRWGVETVKETDKGKFPSRWESMGPLEERGRRGVIHQWLVGKLESLFGKEDATDIANRVILLIPTG